MTRILIVDTVCSRKGVVNKDVNGGLGTRTKIGNSVRARILEQIKKSGVVLPLLEFGYLAAILKQKGHEVAVEKVTNQYALEHIGQRIREGFTELIYYPAVVSYEIDNNVAQTIKRLFPDVRQGAIGPFASAMPDKVADYFDWVIAGETEQVFLDTPIEELSGIVRNPKFVQDLDSLPFPDWSVFKTGFSYRPMLARTPFYTIQGSRGCPMSCAFYCPYPASQGLKWRTRSIANIIDEIEHLQRTYGARALLFRDPFFSLNKKRTIEFGEEMLRRNVKIEWGCETRLDALNDDLIRLLARAGLRALNIGVESEDVELLSKNYRKGFENIRQSERIALCHSLGIKVNAFFIFGLDGDTETSIRKTIEYAKSLKTFAVQFTISTPLPGTPFYEQMKPTLLTQDVQFLDNNTLVFPHENLTPARMEELKEQAFVEYYFRPGFFLEQAKWRLRDLFS